jgi:hypothetical protein
MIVIWLTPQVGQTSLIAPRPVPPFDAGLRNDMIFWFTLNTDDVLPASKHSANNFGSATAKRTGKCRFKLVWRLEGGGEILA